MPANTILELDDQLFQALVGEDILKLIYKRAPRKVYGRVGSALRHFVKAHALSGIDEEMAAIRLIAAEEELVDAATAAWSAMRDHPGVPDFVRTAVDGHVGRALATPK